MSAALWIRGMLQDEHGVDWRSFDWYEGGVNNPRPPDETMDLRVRAAGTLVLRYGQPTTHTVELTRDHLITREAGGLPASENPAELWQV